MQQFFIGTYNFFNKNKFAFILTIIGIFLFIGISIYNIKLEEDINAIIPQDNRIDKINLVLENSKFADQIILNFSLNDTTKNNADSLKSQAEKLVKILEKDTALIKNINFKISKNSFQDVFDFFYKNLPFYLSDKDYIHLDSILTNKSKIAKTLEKSYKSLISPAGIATKKYIFRDPFSITPLALNQLQNFQLDDNFIIHKSCIYTKNKHNLLVFIEPKYPSGNIDKNKVLVQKIDSVTTAANINNSTVNVEYYGGTAVAAANAKRIKLDIMLTVNIAFVFIFVLFFLFFRKIKVLLLLFIPVVFGAGIAISLISFISGGISAIALGIGAILVGISIDYSLHIFTHFRSSGSIKQTLKDVSLPIIMSSGTTASAFLCLFVIKSEALNQLGMFGAFSVFFAALTVLLIIPFLLSRKGFQLPQKTSLAIFDKIASYKIHRNKYAIIAVITLTITFSFFVKNVGFNSDISGLNYLPDNLAKAEKNIHRISSEALSAVYLVSIGKTLEEALEVTESKEGVFKKAEKLQLFSSKSSATDLVLSKQKQIEKIKKWNTFWASVNKDTLKQTIINNAPQFKENAFNKFYSLINNDYKPIKLNEFNVLQDNFLSNYINQSDSLHSVISILKVDKKDKEKLFAMFENEENIIIFDKQYFANKFFDVLTEDFNKLVILSMIIVFLILLISFGRIELAIITFTPIIISWLWTLGLMGLFGIKFNIFNIIISTFIFGLGIDYSIFIMRGLLNNYKYGNHPLAPYKLSVLLSFITTILGIGVLIFAHHPALKSIAMVSIFGIASVVIISYTIIPLLFNILSKQKGRIRSEPLTMQNSIISIISLLLFIVLALILTLLIPILYILPLPRKHIKYFFHTLISASSKFIVWINFTIKKEKIDFDKINFSKPSVIVANHQSHLDLVLLLRLNPKIIVVTNKWVWSNPIYGFVVQFANYFPIHNGIEVDYNKVKKKIQEGYSILIFPEGTRTTDGTIKRFHQGAFKIADDLNLNIQPVVIHGAYQCLPKKEFFMRSGKIAIKFLDKVQVKSVNTENNETYLKQAKNLTKLIRNKYNALSLERETPDFYKAHLINQFIYKGPVVEWYTKVKLKLEKNYNFFNDIIPRDANIVDIGCGYGYLGLMLNYVSPSRKVNGIDYDTDKINTANYIAKKNANVNFTVSDITEEELPKADVYILNDVLHYMPEALQINVLTKCFKNVSQNGIIIVRDADADLEKRTKVTKATEIQSTKIFRFNKTKYDLSFISGKIICNLATKNGFSCKRVDNSKHTSNITYIIRNEQ